MASLNNWRRLRGFSTFFCPHISTPLPWSPRVCFQTLLSSVHTLAKQVTLITWLPRSLHRILSRMVFSSAKSLHSSIYSTSSRLVSPWVLWAIMLFSWLMRGIRFRTFSRLGSMLAWARMIRFNSTLLRLPHAIYFLLHIIEFCTGTAAGRIQCSRPCMNLSIEKPSAYITICSDL